MRKVTYLFSIFTSRPLIGTLKIHFEPKPTLKTFNISMERPYYFSFYLLEDLKSSLVTVMQILTGTHIRNACEKEKHSMRIGSFSVLRI